MGGLPRSCPPLRAWLLSSARCSRRWTWDPPLALVVTAPQLLCQPFLPADDPSGDPSQRIRLKTPPHVQKFNGCYLADTATVHSHFFCTNQHSVIHRRTCTKFLPLYRFSHFIYFACHDKVSRMYIASPRWLDLVLARPCSYFPYSHRYLFSLPFYLPHPHLSLSPPSNIAAGAEREISRGSSSPFLPFFLPHLRLSLSPPSNIAMGAEREISPGSSSPFLSSPPLSLSLASI